MIHTFGDSHAGHAWEKIENVKSHWIGSSLCYSFGRDRLQRLNIKDPSYEVNESDVVCFCFGEIDCRCHVHKYVNQQTSHEKIIDEIVENYFLAIEENVKQFNVLKTCVFNVVPPHPKGFGENKDFPFLGTDQERVTYTKYFNKKLQDFCLKYDYIFIDVYDQYSNEDGTITRSKTDGGVHLMFPDHIVDFLKSRNLIQ